MRLRIPLTVCAFWAGSVFGQNINGMVTGNYAGIAGLQFNPASIVDSRYKFDLNIAAAQFTFANNYLNMKPGVFARRLFQKSPYNSSWESVTQDLVTPLQPASGGKVYGRLIQNYQLPLSMMFNTGKRSAMAINLRNRYVAQLNNLNPQTADFLYGQLRNPELFGVNMDNSGLTSRFLNWQEVGITYGRVIFNWNKHFLKAAVTAKWLGGNAGAIIDAPQLSLNFADSQRLSVRSPGITYARTTRADFGLFNRRDFLSDLEGQNLGMDLGIVYEFRGRIGNFRYTDEDYKSMLRRDKNKYTLRLGVALNDVGVMQFDQRLPLTKNHSANFTNWNFGGVKANNISEWDTAYSKQVTFAPNQPQGFSIQLPTALVANVDLHLFGGFYINAAAQRMVNISGKKADARLNGGEWVAITPRLEGRIFGIYVPVLLSDQETAVGATLRFGPIYVGSNNLLELIGNEKVPQADVHAGFRISIGHGKPTKLAKALEKQTGVNLSEETEDLIDSIRMSGKDLESRVALLERMADSNFRPTVIVNNYITDSAGKTVMTSAVDNQRKTATSTSAEDENVETITQAQYDSISSANAELRKKAEKRLKKEGIKEPKSPKSSSASTTNSSTKKASKKAEKQRQRYETDQRRYNEAIENEMSKMRKQQALSTTALVGAITAGTVVDANASKKKPDTVRVVKTDTIYAGGTRIDTVMVRDTVKVPQGISTTPEVAVPGVSEPKEVTPAILGDYKIYFASGNASVAPAYKDLLDEVGKTIRDNPGATIRLVGQTDATGSVAANKVLAGRRIDAVVQQLKYRGIDITKLEKEVLVGEEKSKTQAEEKRRVDIIVQGQ